MRYSLKIVKTGRLWTSYSVVACGISPSDAQLFAAGEAGRERPKPGDEQENDRSSTDGYGAPMGRKTLL